MVQTQVSQSPLPLEPTVKKMNFYEALKEVAAGKKITKLEWKDKEYYGILNDSRLQLHKPDGKLYDWLISDADLTGTDWVVL